tara:strand:- start:493 stop:1257 length:765 start_codon:yes stop_codon:yes gene_type:complete
MAHNKLTGTVIAPRYFGPGISEGVNILSGNLSTSDAAEVINVPRVSNATDNSIITNVGGDANNLTCESNLKFDASNATLNITGHLTASVGLSASYFYGDGSRLTGISAGGGGSGGGIFTELSVNTAATTSSIQVGAAAAPSHTLSVAGASFLSGAVIHKRHATTANYIITISDYYIGTDTSSNPILLNLPTASAAAEGQAFIIKDEGGNATNNNITISASGNSDFIDGQKFIVLESPHASVQLYCDGATKYYIC